MSEDLLPRPGNLEIPDWLKDKQSQDKPKPEQAPSEPQVRPDWWMER